MPKPEIKLKKPELNIVDPNRIHHLLEPGELGAVLELIILDPRTGKITEHRVVKSQSFVRQFLEILYIKMNMQSGALTYSIRDTSNTLRSCYLELTGGPITFDTNAGAGIITYGIVIGTGAVAPTIDNYALGAQIPHATMNHSAMTFGAPAADATTSQLTLTRNFANVSGGGVTVNEVGLCGRAWYWNTAGYFLLIRDVIAGGLLVPNGQTLTVNYREQAVA